MYQNPLIRGSLKKSNHLPSTLYATTARIDNDSQERINKAKMKKGDVEGDAAGGEQDQAIESAAPPQKPFPSPSKTSKQSGKEGQEGDEEGKGKQKVSFAPKASENMEDEQKSETATRKMCKSILASTDALLQTCEETWLSKGR